MLRYAEDLFGSGFININNAKYIPFIGACGFET